MRNGKCRSVAASVSGSAETLTLKDVKEMNLD